MQEQLLISTKNILAEVNDDLTCTFNPVCIQAACNEDGIDVFRKDIMNYVE